MAIALGVQRIVAEDFRRPFRYRDEYPREVVLLLLSRGEPQKVVEAIRPAGKTRPDMPAGVERFDYDSGGDASESQQPERSSGPDMEEARTPKSVDRDLGL